MVRFLACRLAVARLAPPILGVLVLTVAIFAAAQPLLACCETQRCKQSTPTCDGQSCTKVPTSLNVYAGALVAEGWFGSGGNCGTQPCAPPFQFLNCPCGPPLANEACSNPCWPCDPCNCAKCGGQPLASNRDEPGTPDCVSTRDTGSDPHTGSDPIVKSGPSGKVVARSRVHERRAP